VSFRELSIKSSMTLVKRACILLVVNTRRSRNMYVF
jgi:hypothetical protein